MHHDADMSDPVFDILNDLDHRTVASRPYAITQPQFKIPSQPMPPRDRYRTRGKEDVICDIPESEGCGSQESLDSFGEHFH